VELLGSGLPAYIKRYCKIKNLYTIKGIVPRKSV
jgi:hypothetical protein